MMSLNKPEILFPKILDVTFLKKMIIEVNLKDLSCLKLNQ